MESDYRRCTTPLRVASPDRQRRPEARRLADVRRHGTEGGGKEGRVATAAGFPTAPLVEQDSVLHHQTFGTKPQSQHLLVHPERSSLGPQPIDRVPPVRERAPVTRSEQFYNTLL